MQIIFTYLKKIFTHGLSKLRTTRKEELGENDDTESKKSNHLSFGVLP